MRYFISTIAMLTNTISVTQISNLAGPGQQRIPFVNLMNVISYWNICSNTSEVIANSCSALVVFDKVLDFDIHRLAKTNFHHSQHSGTLYSRVVHRIYEAIPQQELENS
jgi:hypothetical protein